MIRAPQFHFRSIHRCSIRQEQWCPIRPVQLLVTKVIRQLRWSLASRQALLSWQSLSLSAPIVWSNGDDKLAISCHMFKIVHHYRNRCTHVINAIQIINSFVKLLTFCKSSMCVLIVLGCFWLFDNVCVCCKSRLLSSHDVVDISVRINLLIEQFCFDLFTWSSLR